MTSGFAFRWSSIRPSQSDRHVVHRIDCLPGRPVHAVDGCSFGLRCRRNLGHFSLGNRRSSASRRLGGMPRSIDLAEAEVESTLPTRCSYLAFWYVRRSL